MFVYVSCISCFFVNVYRVPGSKMNTCHQPIADRFDPLAGTKNAGSNKCKILN